MLLSPAVGMNRMWWDLRVLATAFCVTNGGSLPVETLCKVAEKLSRKEKTLQSHLLTA